jgi:hypothetical protein
MNLHEVIDRLIDRRGPVDEGEVQVMHDAVAAHAAGLADGEEVRKQREAQADTTLAGEFEGQSDAQVTEAAAGGNTRAQAEFQRRRTLASATPKEAVSAKAETSPNPAPATGSPFA